MLKTVIFDLGNVLFFFDHGKMIQQIGTCCGINPDDLKKIFFQHQVQIAYETGQINSGDIHRILSTHASKPFTLHEWMAAASDIFTPNLSLWPVIETLKKRGMRLVLLSNTTDIHYNYLYSHYDILHKFDAKVLSYEVKAHKPQPLIFHKTLQQIHCAPNECFYTDDIPEFITGARKAGIDSEVFTDVSSLKKHLYDRGCPI
ncbi:MAG: HAD family phosphatase [Chlamydiia bacterium]|nr:HAD family phosphatase [Chlamydiia bacterium]